MSKDKFNKKDIDFYLRDKTFKGLSKEYIMECIFDDEIQKSWSPQEGDIIVGCTGNIFVISGSHNLNSSLGGRVYFFGGGFCNRDGGCIMDSTYCHTANESGKYIHPLDGEKDNLYHSSIRNFRYVPYPHERK